MTETATIDIEAALCREAAFYRFNEAAEAIREYTDRTGLPDAELQDAFDTAIRIRDRMRREIEALTATGTLRVGLDANSMLLRLACSVPRTLAADPCGSGSRPNAPLTPVLLTADNRYAGDVCEQCFTKLAPRMHQLYRRFYDRPGVDGDGADWTTAQRSAYYDQQQALIDWMASPDGDAVVTPETVDKFEQLLNAADDV